MEEEPAFDAIQSLDGIALTDVTNLARRLYFSTRFYVFLWLPRIWRENCALLEICITLANERKCRTAFNQVYVQILLRIIIENNSCPTIDFDELILMYDLFLVNMCSLNFR